MKLKTAGDTVEAEQVYFDQKLPTSIGGAVEVGGYLYGTTKQVVVCADFNSGEVKWQERASAPAPSAMPKVCSTCTAKRMKSRSWSPRPTVTRSTGASRCQINRIAAARTRGLTRWWPTAGSICAI